MAAKLRCRVCARTMYFGDGQGIRLFCSVECDELLIQWLNAAYAKGTGTSLLPRPPLLDQLDEEESKQVKDLIRLAINEAATDGESANAARAACKLIVKLGLLGPW